jgi:phosphomannomutase
VTRCLAGIENLVSFVSQLRIVARLAHGFANHFAAQKAQVMGFCRVFCDHALPNGLFDFCLQGQFRRFGRVGQ